MDDIIEVLNNANQNDEISYYLYNKLIDMVYEKEEIINNMISELQRYGYGKTYVHTEAFSKWNCDECGNENEWPNGNVPKLCKQCIKSKFFSDKKEFDIEYDFSEIKKIIDDFIENFNGNGNN